MNRPPLSRERIIAAAVSLADAAGTDSLSMRALGAELGVEAMSLYRYVSSKDDVLTAMSDLVWSEVDLATGDTDWRRAVRTIAVSVYSQLLAHPWAARDPRVSTGRLRFIDAILAHLTAGGFAPAVIFHAHHSLDGYIQGYALQAIGYTGVDPAAEALVRSLAADLPHLMAHFEQHQQPHEESGFEIGLEMLLDGLEAGRG